MTLEKDYLKICQEATSLVIEVGRYVREEFAKVGAIEIETKSRNSLVSYVDKGAERMLVRGLSAIVPDSVFLTEEDTIASKPGACRWIIDPLDGTTNFLHGLPVFSISIAFEVEGEVLIGIVFDVMREECFYGVKGNGAYLNGHRIKVSDTLYMEDALIATGFPYIDYSRLDSYMQVLIAIMKKARGIRRLGSAAIDLAYVACGRFDGFFEYSLNPWDVAAGLLLVEEAGGKISSFGGEEADAFRGEEVVASSETLYAAFFELINQAFYP